MSTKMFGPGVDIGVVLPVGAGASNVVEEAVTLEYVDAGATEVVFTQTDLGTDEDRRRTWRLLGELARS